ncbi:MAG TPA: Yip1 family protein [Methanocorpusculum sp.]|nr:Yip1 family protein [Methanocorpusculum sp.]
MSPLTIHDGEVQYYSSLIKVKNQRYTSTLTSERLVIEDGIKPREFKVKDIVEVLAITLPNNEPGLKIVLTSKNGKKEMIWAFLDDVRSKEREQKAWVNWFQKMIEKNSFEIPSSPQTPIYDNLSTPTFSIKEPEYSKGEIELLKTAGVRIKRLYYMLYLTNHRLIILSASRESGREFAIAEILDASRMESESGEPSIALAIESQARVKQMILTFPSLSSRETWIMQLSEMRSTSRMPQISPMMLQLTKPSIKNENMHGSQKAAHGPQMLMLQPGERTYLSSPGVLIKQASYTAYLTNTRFVLMSSTNGMLKIAREFAKNMLKKTVRITGERGEPGIGITIASRDGDKEMHMIFPSMDLREKWFAKLEDMISTEHENIFNKSDIAKQDAETMVTSSMQGKTPMKFCTNCGARNHLKDQICAMCNKPLEERRVERDSEEENNSRKHHMNKRRYRCPNDKRIVKKWNGVKQNKGSTLGFLIEPTDIFTKYNRGKPRGSVGMFLFSGIFWAISSVVMLIFILPKILPITTSNISNLGIMQNSIMNMMMLILELFCGWVVFILIQGILAGIFVKMFYKEATISGTLEVVMRSTLPYATIGWIPGFGIPIAAILSLISTINGFNAILDMRRRAAVCSGILSLVGATIVLVGFSILIK